MVRSHHFAPDEQPLVDYLLARLPEPEVERIEEASIVDDDMAARLAAIEDDLVDGYVLGALPGDLRQQFEAVYLASDLGRQKVERAQRFRRAIHDGAAHRAGPLAGPAPVVRSWRSRPFRLAAAASVVLACGVGYQALRVRSPETAAAIPQERLMLSPDVRSAERPPTLVVTGTSDQIVLELRLDANDFDHYEATLNDARGTAVWTSRRLLPASVRPPTAIAVAVPASVLSPQHFSMQLSGIAAAEIGNTPTPRTGAATPAGAAVTPVASYSFDVVRRPR